MPSAVEQHSFDIPADLLQDMRGWRTRLLLAGIVALALCAVGGFFNADQFYRSYIWCYMFFIGVPLGATALLMLQYLTGGAWGVVIRRQCEAASRTLPLLVILFIPIVFGIPHLYEWSHADIVARDAVLRHKSAYLNVPFFLIRAAVYFIGWNLIAHLLYKWSGEQDRGDQRAASRLGALSGPGLVFYGFSVTFMSIDWALSITPHWFSTIYGLLFIAGEGLSAVAFLICLLVIFSSRPPLSDVLTPRHLHDVGKLLLAFVMVWAYFSFSQLVVIWSGNLPEEIPWYLSRFTGGWQYIGVGLVLLHFALPFALLLSRDLKRNFNLLRSVAIMVLVMRFVDLYWVVAPDFHKAHFTISWMDFLLPIGLGGIWLATFLWQLERRPLIPLGDPHLEEALEHGRD
ncbi:MAG TPA: hypothetical protein VMT86_01500 [Bryobacteraceae bacterium]|nr:hypothetical protein [Bryobacteraceae bacterium]